MQHGDRRLTQHTGELPMFVRVASLNRSVLMSSPRNCSALSRELEQAEDADDVQRDEDHQQDAGSPWPDRRPFRTAPARIRLLPTVCNRAVGPGSGGAVGSPSGGGIGGGGRGSTEEARTRSWPPTRSRAESASPSARADCGRWDSSTATASNSPTRARPDRLPPGQYLTDRFPVLHVGDVPTTCRGEWNLTDLRSRRSPFTLDLDELKALPSVTLTFDIHCVTKWSKFDTLWTGVRVATCSRGGGAAGATHVMDHAEFGYTTNVPLADITTDEAIVAYAFDGETIEPIHGGPVRIVVPHLYFWKCAKWVRVLELRDRDQAGFWERNGYHIYGDPFIEQRHWGD